MICKGNKLSVILSTIFFIITKSTNMQLGLEEMARWLNVLDTLEEDLCLNPRIYMWAPKHLKL